MTEHCSERRDYDSLVSIQSACETWDYTESHDCDSKNCIGNCDCVKSMSTLNESVT